MEYALYCFLFIMQEMWRVLLRLVVNKEGGYTIGHVLLAVLIVKTFLWLMGLIDRRVEKSKKSGAE